MEEIATSLLMQIKNKKDRTDSPESDSPCMKVDILSARGLEVDSNYLKLLQLHVLFRGKIFRSSDVIASSDPVFNFCSSFNLNSHEITNATSLLKINDPVLVYVTTTHQNIENQTLLGLQCNKTLLAAAVIDFKYSLLFTGDYVSVELLPCEQDGICIGTTAGVLFLRLSLQNLPSNEILDSIQSLEVEHYITSSQECLTRDNKEFYQLARSWWARARKIYPHVEHHNLKILAKDETGQYRFVCSFVSPIRSPRELDGPRFAARFVSLISFQRDANTLLGSSRVDSCWRSALALLACMQGDVEEHANLLCSLLLGWGMDAWVVQGTITPTPTSTSTPTPSQQPSHRDSRRPSDNPPVLLSSVLPSRGMPYCWVITFETAKTTSVSRTSHGGGGGGGRGGSSSHPTHSVSASATATNTATTTSSTTVATCWEALSGVQYEISPSGGSGGSSVRSKRSHPFLDVFAIYRHDSFLVNVQRNTSIATSNSSSSPITSFDIHDGRCWVRLPLPESDASMGPSHVSLRHPGAVIAQLSPGPSYSLATALEERLESEMRTEVSRWRTGTLGMTTQYDNDLAVVLQPALVAYEWDRVVGVSFGNSDFQASIKRFVRKGEVFKAYPTCFSHVNSKMMIQALQRTQAASDVVLNGEGDSRYAIRMKVFPYPEGLAVVWFMIAVCYVDRNRM